MTESEMTRLQKGDRVTKGERKGVVTGRNRLGEIIVEWTNHAFTLTLDSYVSAKYPQTWTDLQIDNRPLVGLD